jgi:hypothetical protein
MMVKSMIVAQMNPTFICKSLCSTPTHRGAISICAAKDSVEGVIFHSALF